MYNKCAKLTNARICRYHSVAMTTVNEFVRLIGTLSELKAVTTRILEGLLQKLEEEVHRNTQNSLACSLVLGHLRHEIQELRSVIANIILVQDKLLDISNVLQFGR